MNINELPTLTYHFFEAPNKLTITNNDFSIIIETEFDCDSNFVLDAKSFDMLKKLGGPIKVNNNTISFNKYKCQNLDVNKININIDNILYANKYNSDILKEAGKFVNQNNVLKGVLLNDNGDIFATDSFKFYFKREIRPYTHFWSIPLQFISLLPKGEITLNFTANKIIGINNDFRIIGSVYNDRVPSIERICDNFKVLHTVEIVNKPELTYLPCDEVKIKVDNGVHFIFDDNEKSFVVDYDIPTDFNFECKISYNNLIAMLNDNMQIYFSDNMLCVNKKIIICYIREV